MTKIDDDNFTIPGVENAFFSVNALQYISQHRRLKLTWEGAEVEKETRGVSLDVSNTCAITHV